MSKVQCDSVLGQSENLPDAVLVAGVQVRERRTGDGTVR